MGDYRQRIANLLIDFNARIDPVELFPSLVPGATEFVLRDPYAFCVSTCLDRGTKTEIIWTIPFWIFQKVGHFDPNRFYKYSIEELTDLIENLPKKPRYILASPFTIHTLTKIVVEQFDGDASKIWVNKKALDVKKAFLSVYGVGTELSNMAVLLIERAYKIQFTELDHSEMDIKADVHTMRVLYRLGVSSAIKESEAKKAARLLNPTYPGGIDSALWVIGRNWCNPTGPACNQCPLEKECRRIDL